MSSLTASPAIILPESIRPVSENIGFKCARAKYVPDYKNGGLRLASVCEFSRPVFNPDELVPVDDPYYHFVPPAPVDGEKEVEGDPDNEGSENREENIRRSTRRALVNVFDLCVCNNFDLFSTLTFAPDKVDRESYEETYHALKIWLSNRVQRKGLKYVAVPEYHPKSKTTIHFHMLSNSEAVDLVDSGHWAHNEKVYNIPSWQQGFSTAQLIKGENAIDATSKYIAKYMTKSNGNKVGGRYYLSGGDLIRPTYVYGDTIDELVDHSLSEPIYTREISKDWGSFREESFI